MSVVVVFDPDTGVLGVFEDMEDGFAAIADTIQQNMWLQQQYLAAVDVSTDWPDTLKDAMRNAFLGATYDYGPIEDHCEHDWGYFVGDYMLEWHDIKHH